MAIKTMSASSGGGGQYNAGWHELTISKAEYGNWKGPDGLAKRYLDVWFQGYPDNMNMRIYETFTKETNEEFKIASLFRFANAGILEILKDPTGKKPVIQYDDDAKNLLGKVINVLFYKETKTGNNYSRIFDSVAPIEQEGDHISYGSDQVASIKKSVEANLERRQSASSNDTGFSSAPVDTKSTDKESNPVPF
tara:strand:+ start:93 stop:674 length:582 start_codon:yes stop_codon:yes gene_type:complete